MILLEIQKDIFEEKSKINKKKDFKHFLYVLDLCADEVSVSSQMIYHSLHLLDLDYDDIKIIVCIHLVIFLIFSIGILLGNSIYNSIS